MNSEEYNWRELREFVAQERGVPADSLTPETTLFGDLGIDGDDAYEFFEAFQKRFGVGLEELRIRRHFGSEGWPLSKLLILPVWALWMARPGDPHYKLAWNRFTFRTCYQPFMRGGGITSARKPAIRATLNVRRLANAMTLDIAEALWSVGRLRREQLPALATELLASGTDTPAIRRLAGLIGPELDEAAECFSQVLIELGRSKLTKQEAARRLATDLARAVLSGTVATRKAATIGAQYAVAFDYAKSFMGLYAADDEYDCSCHGPDIADREVLQWAEATIRDVPREAV